MPHVKFIREDGTSVQVRIDEYFTPNVRREFSGALLPPTIAEVPHSYMGNVKLLCDIVLYMSPVRRVSFMKVMDLEALIQGDEFTEYPNQGISISLGGGLLTVDSMSGTLVLQGRMTNSSMGVYHTLQN